MRRLWIQSCVVIAMALIAWTTPEPTVAAEMGCNDDCHFGATGFECPSQEELARFCVAQGCSSSGKMFCDSDTSDCPWANYVIVCGL